jgi:hypothetical protein
MALSWNQKQREIYKLFEEGMSFSQIVEQNYAKVTVSAVKKAREAGEKPTDQKAVEVQKEGGGKPQVVNGETNMAVVLTPKPAPISFTFSNINITLDPKNLYDAFCYYEDIKRIDPTINDEFSLAILSSVRYVWRRLATTHAEKVASIVNEEEKNVNGETG